MGGGVDLGRLAGVVLEVWEGSTADGSHLKVWQDEYLCSNSNTGTVQQYSTVQLCSVVQGRQCLSSSPRRAGASAVTPAVQRVWRR